MSLHHLSTSFHLTVLFAFGVLAPRVQAQASNPDASLPIAQRIESLLGRMTLEEKVGQMNMPCVYEAGLGETMAAKTEAVQKFAAGTYVKGLGRHGHLSRH